MILQKFSNAIFYLEDVLLEIDGERKLQETSYWPSKTRKVYTGNIFLKNLLKIVWGWNSTSLFLWLEKHLQGFHDQTSFRSLQKLFFGQKTFCKCSMTKRPSMGLPWLDRLLPILYSWITYIGPFLAKIIPIGLIWLECILPGISGQQILNRTSMAAGLSLHDIFYDLLQGIARPIYRITHQRIILQIIFSLFSAVPTYA